MGTGLGILLAPLFLLPMAMAQKGPKGYWAGMVLSQAIGALLAVLWVAVPWAFWKAFGAWTVDTLALPPLAGVATLFVCMTDSCNHCSALCRCLPLPTARSERDARTHAARTCD
jgi:hypothetical protein